MPILRRSRRVTANAMPAWWPLLLTMLLCPRGASAAVANFWLSNSQSDPTAPTLYVPPGTLQTIDLWARPQAGSQLHAFSLNLFAEPTGGLTFEELTVHNPALQSGGLRHQLVFGSDEGLLVLPTLIEGFVGLTLLDNAPGLPTGGGIGPTCAPDPLCSEQPGGPVWLIATLTYEVGMTLGTATDLYLEIGLQGVAHNQGSPEDTQVVFGAAPDVVHLWDVNAIAGSSHAGLRDARVVVASADFDNDADVDGVDFLIWQRGRGIGTKFSQGDATGDAVVNGIDLGVWQSQFGHGNPAIVVSRAVPEPTGGVVLPAAFWVLARRWRRKTS
jgi:hypothetical protein